MPVKKVWLNLPVKDIQRSKEFFSKLGFSSDCEHGNSEFSAPLILGDDKFNVMLFTEEKFNSFTRCGLSNAKEGAEILISLDAESREEIDDYARKVEEAGGTIFCHPEEHQGWMYGFGFSDLDNHRWNFLYMDFEKLQAQKAPNSEDQEC